MATYKKSCASATVRSSQYNYEKNENKEHISTYNTDNYEIDGMEMYI